MALRNRELHARNDNDDECLAIVWPTTTLKFGHLNSMLNKRFSFRFFFKYIRGFCLNNAIFFVMTSDPSIETELFERSYN